MKVARKRFAELSPADVSQVCSLLDANFSTVFHEPDFNSVVSATFGTDFSYILAYDNRGGLVALCPLHSLRAAQGSMIYSNPTIFEVPYGGWVFNNKKVRLLELMSLVKVSFGDVLSYWSYPQIRVDDYPSVRGKIEFHTAIIDLTLPIDAILHDYVSSNTRHNIRRAPLKGVVTERLQQDRLHIFQSLSDGLKKSIGLETNAGSFYAQLFQKYSARRQMACFVSKLDDRYLSSLLIIGNKHIMHAWVAGRAEQIPKNVYQNELLWWKAINWAREQCSAYFDVCVVEQERLPNIARFKLGFSKRLVPFYCITRRTLGYRILSRIKRGFV